MCVCSWIESDRDESADANKIKSLLPDPQSALPAGRADRNVYDFEAANANFQNEFRSGSLKAPPARKIAVVTCMDARLHPEKFLGLRFGDAHMIRNAGGRISDDALRSLVISQRFLGTEEVVVIHHTQCGEFTSLSRSLPKKSRCASL